VLALQLRVLFVKGNGCCSGETSISEAADALFALLFRFLFAKIGGSGSSTNSSDSSPSGVKVRPVLVRVLFPEV
jgi:hypothetical protein